MYGIFAEKSNLGVEIADIGIAATLGGGTVVVRCAVIERIWVIALRIEVIDVEGKGETVVETPGDGEGRVKGSERASLH